MKTGIIIDVEAKPNFDLRVYFGGSGNYRNNYGGMGEYDDDGFQQEVELP